VLLLNECFVVVVVVVVVVYFVIDYTLVLSYRRNVLVMKSSLQ